MKKIIKIDGEDLELEFKTPPRSRSLKILVYKNGRVVLTRPSYISFKRAEAYLQSKLPWLKDALYNYNIKLPLDLNKNIREQKTHYLKYKQQARALIIQRTAEISSFYGFKYKKISIRNQKTRWGSCSLAGNLSFNYRLLFLSSQERDYIIAHELCHIKEFNHSPRFWHLVSQFCPDYKLIRRKLKKIPHFSLD